MNIVRANEETIVRAAHALKAGGLVAFPTETVYGLGADATQPRAVAGVFAAKGRPAFNPLIVHVPDAAAAATLIELGTLGGMLADALWPGPLTLVARMRPDSGIADLVTAGLDTLGVRVPAHPVARALLAEAGCPVAAPSANRSGRVSPTRAQHVGDDLGDLPAMILDAGPCRMGLESTIVHIDGDTARLLRPGAIARTTLIDLLGDRLQDAPSGAATPTAPGQLASHYAPRARVRLDAETAEDGEAFLGFGLRPQPEPGVAFINLSRPGDLTEAAANLFGALRELDASGAATIAVAPIPHEGLGEAINDRLRRAAAPRNEG